MAPRVDQRRSLVDAPLDAAPSTLLDLDLDLVTEEAVDTTDPTPADTPAQMSLWDLTVPPPRARSAAPLGGTPNLPPSRTRVPRPRHRDERPPPLDAEPEVMERATPSESSEFDPFGDTMGPALTSLPAPPPPEPVVYEAEPAAPAADPEPPVVEPPSELRREAEGVARPEEIEIVARFDDLAPRSDEVDTPREAPRVESLPRTVVFSEAVAWVGTLPRWTRRAAAAVVAAGLLVAAMVTVASPDGESDDGPAVAAPASVLDPNLTRVARARLPLIDVFVNPDEPRVLTTLEHPTPSGTPLVFVIEGEWADWYKVRVPAPPADTTGWVRAGDVEVSEHEVRITVDLHDRLLTAREGGEIVLRAPIAVGRIDAPEPGPSFVTDRVAVSNPNTGYGAYAMPLAGYENGEATFFRGQGLVAIHGTDTPLSLGQTVAKGSVALANDDARILYELAPLGTPVEIVDRSTDLAAGS